MIDIRRIAPDEIEQARRLVPEGYAEPDWRTAFVILEDDVLVGVLATQVRLCVEPLYILPKHPLALVMAVSWVDGLLRAVASHMGLAQYEFFVADAHSQFQRVIEKHLPVESGREPAGNYYIRKVN